MLTLDDLIAEPMNRIDEYDDDQVVTAAAEVDTGAMIALLPSVADAAIMELTGAYAEPADQLHVTLLYLGEAASWSAEYRRLLTDVVAEIVANYVMIETSTFSVNVFNPTDDEFDTAVVLGVRGTDLLVALHKAISTNITDVFDDEVPEQHNPWVPHITLAYTDEVAEVMLDAMEKLGPVTFDRVGVFFGGKVTELPLGVQNPDDPIVAAGDPEWDESKIKRDSEGKFAKKTGAKLLGVIELAAKLVDDVKSGKFSDGTVIESWEHNGVKRRVIVGGGQNVYLQRWMKSTKSWKIEQAAGSKQTVLVSEIFHKAMNNGATFRTHQPENVEESSLTTGITDFLKGDTDELPFDFTDQVGAPNLDLDAVAPPDAKSDGKTKYSDPLGRPNMLVLAADPGKSGDGYAKKDDGSKGPWGRYGAAGVLLRHRGEDGVDRYLLVARGEKLSQSGKWQLPGGGLDSKETPFQGAAREVVEELGLDPAKVAEGRVHGFHEAEVPDTDGWKYTSIAATVPEQLEPDLSGENAKLETGDAKWLTIDEIRTLDKDGKLLGPLAGGQLEDNILDLFPPDSPKVAKTKQPSAADAIAAGDFSGLKKISGPKGSNEGGIFEAPDGSRWYVKKQKSVAHAQNEHDASALYRAAGIDVPEVIIGGGTPGLGAGVHTATRIVPEGDAKLGNVVAFPGKNPDKLLAAREGFAVDALLANWDVAGLTYDNIIFDQDGKPHRIDVGGALEYRAQGGKKGSAFGTEVTEWDTLRDPKKNPQSAKLFAGLSDSELVKAVEHVERLTPEKIREVVEDKELAEKIIARRNNLLKRAEQEGVLSSTTGDVGFHPVDDHSLDLGIAGKTDEEFAAMVQVGHVVDDKVDVSSMPITKGGPPVTKDTVWWDVQSGNYGEAGEVFATGTKNGVNYRLVVAKKSNGETYIVEQLENTPGTWVMYAGFPTETSFKNAPLSKYGINNPPKNVDVVDDEIDTDVLSPTDAFKQHMADKSKVPTTPTVQALTGEVFDYSADPQEDIWAKVTNGDIGHGDIIFKGTSLDGKENPLQVVVRFDAATGEPYLEELEYDKIDDHWFVGRTWHSQDEFDAADLSEYDINKKSSIPSTMGIDFSNGVIPVDPVHPGPFSTTGASHAKLWNQVGNGQYAAGHAVAGGVNLTDGSYHRLVAHQYGSGQWALLHEFEDPPGSGDFYPLGTYKTLTDFAEADFSYMGIGKPMTPPGPVKSAVTPASVPSVAPKKVPKLTNAIIYGKYQDGEVIATDGKGFFRVVYKNNKIHIQTQSPDGTWKGIGYGKAEAYKKLQGADAGSGWFLGDVTPPPTKAPIVVTPMTEVTPSAPSGTTVHLDLEETIKQGQYQEGDIVATYTKKASAEDVRVIFSKGKFVKQTKSKLASPGASWTNSKTYDDDDALLSSMAKGSGVWTKADEASGGLKSGAKAPAILTSTVAESIKKTFDDQGVKWHTSAELMLVALSNALKTHPDFTSAQILAYMDTTTKTKTSPTPFTDKVTKYLKTKNGVSTAKSLGLPISILKKSSTTVSTPTAPKYTGPTVTIHDVPNVGPTAAPGTYEVKGVSGMLIIHNEMMSTYGQWTPAQRAALKAYTGSSYVEMNGCLRKTQPCAPSTLKRIADAISAMRPTTKPFRVTRGAGWSAVGLPSSDKSMTRQQRIKLTQELEGKILEEPGFFSTSAAKTPAFSSKPVRFIVDVPAGVPGAWVDIISVHTEYEFLLAAGLKYRVKKVTPPSGSSDPIIVHLEVIIP